MKKRVSDKICARLDAFDKNELSNFIHRVDAKRQFLDTIVNLLQEAVILIDPKGFIEFSNQVALRLLGLHGKTNAPIWKWIPGLKKLFSLHTNGVQPDVIEQEIHLPYPEDRIVRLHLQTFPSFDDGEPHFILILYDITKDAVANEERMAQGCLDSVVQLASEVAHELGNPLNSISIHLQLIKRQIEKLSLKDCSLKDSTQICVDEVDRLNEIIKNFLQAVRPKRMELKKGDIVEVLKKVLSVLSPQLTNLHIRVDLNIQETLPLLSIDKARLHQAFFNVLKNSMEAIGADGWIRISLFTDSSHLIIAFADSGTGITSDQAVQMATHPVSFKAQGNGLGMLIVRRILKEHGGSLELESKEGVGTIIYLKFPLPQAYLKKLSDKTLSPSDKTPNATL